MYVYDNDNQTSPRDKINKWVNGKKKEEGIEYKHNRMFKKASNIKRCMINKNILNLCLFFTH